jgi:hypothetical protein
MKQRIPLGFFKQYIYLFLSFFACTIKIMKVKKTTGDRPNLLVKLLGEITEGLEHSAIAR